MLRGPNDHTTKMTLLEFCHPLLAYDVAFPRFLDLSVEGSENSLVQMLDLMSMALVISYSGSAVHLFTIPGCPLRRVDLEMTHIVLSVSSRLHPYKCRPISVRACLSPGNNLTHLPQGNSSPWPVGHIEPRIATNAVQPKVIK